MKKFKATEQDVQNIKNCSSSLEMTFKDIENRTADDATPAIEFKDFKKAFSALMEFKKFTDGLYPFQAERKSD